MPIITPEIPAMSQGLQSQDIERLLISIRQDLLSIESGAYGLKVNTSRVTSSPYTVLPTDDDIFVDTDSAAVTVNLPVGVNGKRYRVINTGSSNNNVTLSPNGTELLLGANSSFTLLDGDVLTITYETTEGWW